MYVRYNVQHNKWFIQESNLTPRQRKLLKRRSAPDNAAMDDLFALGKCETAHTPLPAPKTGNFWEDLMSTTPQETSGEVCMACCLYMVKVSKHSETCVYVWSVCLCVVVCLFRLCVS